MKKKKPLKWNWSMKDAKPIFKIESSKVIEDEKGLTFQLTGKYLGEGTIQEWVDKMNKYF